MCLLIYYVKSEHNNTLFLPLVPFLPELLIIKCIARYIALTFLCTRA